MTGRASSSIIFLILQALCFSLKNRSYLGLMNGRFRSRYLIRFNARKIYDIVDSNQGISPRERKAKLKNYSTFERYFQDISSMTGRYLINALNLFKKRVDLLSFQRYYIQKVKSYHPLLSPKFSIFNSFFFIQLFCNFLIIDFLS